MDGGLGPQFMINIPDDNWRNDPGLIRAVDYKKKFAILPVTCYDGVKVWLRYYYTKYHYWGYRSIVTDHDEGTIHIDKIEDITEAEYIVRKLIEGF